MGGSHNSINNFVRNILVLTYWSFNDPLIQTYTLPYLKIMISVLPAGSKIYLLCLEQKQYAGETQDTVSKLRDLEALGIHVIQKKYVPFGTKAILAWAPILVQLSAIILLKKIKYIHCWCTPPAIFGLILAKVWRRKLILDSYEPHAETMLENNVWHPSSRSYKILNVFEKLMTKNADFIIGTTKGMLEYAKRKYGHSIRNFEVKPACVNVEQFNFQMEKDQGLAKSLGLQDKTVMLYAGKFGGIYYDKEVFEFIKVARDYFGADKFRALILSNHSQEEIELFCKEIDLDSNCIVLRFVKHQEIQNYMRLADFAICPVRSIPTKRYCTPIKTGEYWSMGLPVMISKDISDDSRIISERKIGYEWQSMDNQEFLRSCAVISEMMKDNTLQERVRITAFDYRDFDIAIKVYEKVYG